MKGEAMTTRAFHLGDVLSVTTGRLLSPRLVDGLYDILNYLTGDDLMTHQLPRASTEAKPFLIQQHPWLAAITADEVTPTNWQAWLDEKVAKHGKTVTVAPIPQDRYSPMDPVGELMSMTDKPVIVVKAPR